MKKSVSFSLAVLACGLLLVSCPLPLPQLTREPVVALPPDVVNDIPRSITGAFTFQTLLPVELRLDVELYNAAGGSAVSRAIGAEGAVVIATLKDSRGNLVYAGRMPGGRLRALVMLPSAPDDMTLTLHSDGYLDRSVSIADMVVSSEVSRTMGMLSQGARAKSVLPTDDRDGDLIPDVYDAFPDDSESAFAYRIPAEGNLTVAYEDLYGLAQAGDADYNDFIAEYSITEVTNGGNELHRIEVEAELTVKLAGYDHLFGIRVDGFAGSARLTGVRVDQNGSTISMDRTEMSFANIELFMKSGAALLKYASFALEFDAPQVIDPTAGTPTADRPPYNPYLVVLDTGQEIHLMGEQDLSGIPHSYQDLEGFPWGLLIPRDWENPAETQRIEVRYPRFTNWRQSFGAEFTDWYLHLDDPYVPPTGDIYIQKWQVTSGSDAESSPRLGRDATGELVVYTSQPSLGGGSYGPGSILFQRLNANGSPSGRPAMVSLGTTDDKFGDVSGSRIVHTAFESTTSALGTLKLYDTAQGTTVDVMPDADTVREARIDGDVVVWTQGQNGATKVLYRDLNWPDGVTVTLGGPIPSSSDVEIGSRYVVWEKYVNASMDIGAYDRLTGATISVSADSALQERLPTTSGNWVAWQADGSSGKTIRLANLAIKPVSPFTAVDNGSNLARPCIDGDLVAYESDAAGNLDIYLYRISDGRTFQLTDDPADQFLVNLSGNKVAYVDLRNGSLDIYVAAFSFPE